MGYQDLTYGRPVLPPASLSAGPFTLSRALQGNDGIIPVSVLPRLQAEILQLLRNKIIQYNRTDSTSIRVESAQHILESIFYTIDLYLTSGNDPNQSLAMLEKTPITVLYGLGYELLLVQIEESRAIYRQILGTRLNIATHAYYSTIDTAIPGFFANYDPVFGAHDTIASIDYPLLLDSSTTTGIAYIKHYLERLDLENLFCQAFPASAIRNLLSRYGETYSIDYRDTLANISDVVLSNATLSLLAGNPPGDLDISSGQLQLLAEILGSTPPLQLRAMLCSAQQELFQNLSWGNNGFADYCAGHCDTLIPRIVQGLEHRTLANVAITSSVSKNRSDAFLFRGTSLDSQSYRRLVAELLQCRDSAAKVSLIAEQLQSLPDYIDILEADCLDRDDYLELFASLGALELSILARIALPEELRDSNADGILNSDNLEHPGTEWQFLLKQFLSQLPAERWKTVKNLIAAP